MILTIFLTIFHNDPTTRGAENGVVGGVDESKIFKIGKNVFKKYPSYIVYDISTLRAFVEELSSKNQKTVAKRAPKCTKGGGNLETDIYIYIWEKKNCTG